MNTPETIVAIIAGAFALRGGFLYLRMRQQAKALGQFRETLATVSRHPVHDLDGLVSLFDQYADQAVDLANSGSGRHNEPTGKAVS